MLTETGTSTQKPPASQLWHLLGRGVGGPPNIPPIFWPFLPCPSNFTCSREGSCSHTHLTPFSSCSELAMVPQCPRDPAAGSCVAGPQLQNRALPVSVTQPCRSRQYEQEKLPLPWARTVPPARCALPLLSLDSYVFAPKCFLDWATSLQHAPRLQPLSPWDHAVARPRPPRFHLPPALQSAGIHRPLGV